MRIYKPTRRTADGQRLPYDKFYCELRTADGRIMRLPGFENQRLTESLGRNVQRLIDCRASGETLPQDTAKWIETLPRQTTEVLARWGLLKGHTLAASQPLSKHAIDWIEGLRAKGVTAKRLSLLEYRMEKLIDVCRITFWAQLTPDMLQQFFAAMRDGPDGVNIRTRNAYVQTIKQFCIWMVREGRATQSPAIGFTGMNAKGDRRHVRRAFSVDEIRHLLAAAETGKPWRGVPGPERAMIYRLAVETGLRAGEIAAITRQCFKLDDTPPTVELSAEFTKNRQYAIIELRPDTAVVLKAFLAGKMPMAAAFNMPSTSITARMLRADLASARAKYLGAAATAAERTEREQSGFCLYADDQGRVGDFHSLRHTCGTWLAASGAHPKVIQSIMRHSTITLTMDTYGHRLMEQESAALAKLPDLSLPPEGQSQRATGTAGKPVDPMARSGALLGTETRRPVAPGSAVAMQGHDEEKPLPMRESGDNQGKTTDWRRGESNPYLRIANAPSCR
jgi:integrase